MGHKQPTNHVRVGGSIFRKRTPRHAIVPMTAVSCPAAHVGLSGAGFFCPWCRIQDLCNNSIALILLRFSFGKVHCRKARKTHMPLETAV
jgi:hypothetical protein